MRAPVLFGSALAALSLTAAACGGSGSPATNTGHMSHEQHMTHNGSTGTGSGNMMHESTTTTESGSMVHESTTTTGG
jgi:hypothetical protein